MHTLELVLALLVAVVALAPVAPLVQVPTPILLVLGGLLLALLPQVPDIVLAPDLAFLLFRPPLLYSAAFDTSIRDVRAHLQPILSLAIGLVLATALRRVQARPRPGARRGHVYTNSIDFLWGQEAFRPGLIALVTPDGAVRQVADHLAFPHGMVVTPDNAALIVAESFTGKLTAFDIAADGSLSGRRVWADLGGPGKGDGICLDAEGAIWCSVVHESRPACWRVRQGGEVLERIELDKGCYACRLGGEDGRTLFLLVAEWWGVERMGELVRSRTGQVLTARAPAPHAGWP